VSLPHGRATYTRRVSLHLFAGLRVRDFQAARSWYEQLLGEPMFFPHATEAV
jgi:catechol 2,3-dioxygenase-like lactoylglutathione lyase family enzyme